MLCVTYCIVCFDCSVYAIGDCIAGPMLAHKAEDEGKALISLLFYLLISPELSFSAGTSFLL